MQKTTEKKEVFLGEKDSLVLNAIITNLTMVLGVKNRIRSIPTAVRNYCKQKSLEICSSGIYNSMNYLEEVGFIKKFEKTKANGGKREVMVYDFQEDFFNSVIIKEEKRRSPKERRQTHNLVPAPSKVEKNNVEKECQNDEVILVKEKLHCLKEEIGVMEKEIERKREDLKILEAYLSYKEKIIPIIAG